MAAPETKQDWNPTGRFKCVCRTDTHAQGQRFNSPQCSYCVEVVDRIPQNPCRSHVGPESDRRFCEQGEEGHWGTCIGDKPEAQFKAERAAFNAWREERT